MAGILTLINRVGDILVVDVRHDRQAVGGGHGIDDRVELKT